MDVSSHSSSGDRFLSLYRGLIQTDHCAGVDEIPGMAMVE